MGNPLLCMKENKENAVMDRVKEGIRVRYCLKDHFIKLRLEPGSSKERK